jgi:hypothetical protein
MLLFGGKDNIENYYFTQVLNVRLSYEQLFTDLL